MTIRNRYNFSRPLSELETNLLSLVIGWRRGSSMALDDTGAVVGCVAHPDDFEDFRKEVRKLGKKKLAEDSPQALKEPHAQSRETAAKIFSCP